MESTSILRTLADTTYDSVLGYRKAAEKADSPNLKRVLEQRAQEREQTLAKLNAELQRHGEEPVTSGTTAGWMHRKFIEISNLFESGDETAAERVEEGEDYISTKFSEALDDDDLDPQTREAIAEVYGEIQRGERFADQLEATID